MDHTRQKHPQATIHHCTPPRHIDIGKYYTKDDETIYIRSPNYECPIDFDDISTIQDLQFSLEVDSMESNSADDYTTFSYPSTSKNSISPDLASQSDAYESSSISKSIDTADDNSFFTNTDNDSTQSTNSTKTTNNKDDEARETLPRSFLALKGISIANYNMKCNFSIDIAITLMNKHQLFILTIQEHSPWNRDLTQLEKDYIIKTGEKWAFKIIITKMQIIIIDKQILPCLQGTKEYFDGRIISSEFTITQGNEAVFVSVYGYPHSPNNRQVTTQDSEATMNNMRELQKQLKTIIRKAQSCNKKIFVFGDLQDTPDETKTFIYGSTRIAKHPLGIVKTCEEFGMQCTIFQHLHAMDKPVTSRHGSKGGRFLDGMYTFPKYLPLITGITILQDTGIFSDHDLVISKCDLGIQLLSISKEKEEKIDFKQIMAIPVNTQRGHDHPTLREDVFKGAEYRSHAKLLNLLQEICEDPQYKILDQITTVKNQLESLENEIINRTKQDISPEDQIHGKLIQRIPLDAQRLNDASHRFFEIIYDICRHARLSRRVPIINNMANQTKRQDIISEKIIPGIAAIPITKCLDDTQKRARRMLQRILITLHLIIKYQRLPHNNNGKQKTYLHLQKAIKRMINCHSLFINSLMKTHQICSEITEDRANHIQAIEHARHKKFFDNLNEFQYIAIESQGKKEYQEFLDSIKRQLFHDQLPNNTERRPAYERLATVIPKWRHIFHIRESYNNATMQMDDTSKVWYRAIKQSKSLIKSTILLIKSTRHEEWKRAKNHYIRIGKHGNIARMINPKARTGPSACNVFPTIKGKQGKKAISNQERKDASIMTHTMWTANPPGNKNCHFLTLTNDDIGPNGIIIDAEKPFDDEAQQLYLDGPLDEKVDPEIAARIRQAHQKLPELFKQINTDKTIKYPFYYDCCTGNFHYEELENGLRKNIQQGNGKARATGFAIPVLGRLPKIFTDTYLIKCKIQLTLRLLDLATENSLRICIGKPCGGTRPLTVGHDDNVFLNGFAQQALQTEIARLKILPENLCSYQKGRGCSDATIVNCVTKEIALQSNKYYLAEIDDDAEKMFDRLYLELQVALLQMAGAGKQGFSEWQCANLTQRTNKLITDIFVTVVNYQCGLPQGNGFSVEIANLHALCLLVWWNMDPIQQSGSISSFDQPRHGFPLIADGIVKYATSLAYVDDTTRAVAKHKEECTVEEFFTVVQGYCDLLADLSLVIKMGRNVSKCSIRLYNIPEGTIVPKFTSIAWAYDAQGPIKGTLKAIVMQRDQQQNLLCYKADKEILNNAPPHIKDVLSTRKYLGVAYDTQLDETEGKEKLIKKLTQRIGLVASKMNSIKEACIAHNMLACQVATFSPICIPMSIQDCHTIDKAILTTYHYRLKLMTHDAKHSIFLPEKIGGLGVKSFTQQYITALIRDIEVYISNEGSLPTHGLIASIEAATQQTMFLLMQDGKIKENLQAHNRVMTYNISRRRTCIYNNNFESPSAENYDYNHPHCMAKAINTTASVGFMLRDLNKEYVARFTDNLLLLDKKVKLLGGQLVKNRATLGPTLGDGTKNCYKYSLLGQIYLFSSILIEEIEKETEVIIIQNRNAAIEQRLTRPAYYKQTGIFSGMIAPTKLAACARKTLLQFKNDYKIASFCRLIEWRCRKDAIHLPHPSQPTYDEYRTIISDNNCFQPQILHTMQQNSENLSKHLLNILQLNNERTPPLPNNELFISDQEIIEHATKHEHPMVISIDGSISPDGIATTTISILAPDIQAHDPPSSTQWQHRCAKVLLIRSWQHPRRWGTTQTNINHAEAIGFILGAYTTLNNVPVLYVTDSNNARTLQRNIKFLDNHTHRKQILQVKQGIATPIANHLEHLTRQWTPIVENIHGQNIIKKGLESCKIWATANNPTHTHHRNIDDFYSEEDQISDYDSDVSSHNNLKIHAEKDRYKFDETMFDDLHEILVLKVFSHQLDNSFQIQQHGKHPSPNLFIVSANQIADNAVTQARHIIQMDNDESMDCLRYPPFSPRWCFSYDGIATSNGAANLFKNITEKELYLRLMHRPKQGLFARMLPFIAISMDQIGLESLHRNILKMSAPCWTRCIYRYPKLANRIWKSWKAQLPDHQKILIAENIPSGWQKITHIEKNIIKACPFCNTVDDDADRMSGNLEHLHVYCPSPILVSAREHCHQKIEDAIYALYNYAASREFGTVLENSTRITILQERIETTARNTEKTERQVVRNKQLVIETRTENTAILSKHSIDRAILLNKLPIEKAQDYQKFPLSYRAGFIHSIPEEDFDVSTATIIDVGFLGILPKPILSTLHQYGKDIERTSGDSSEFETLITQMHNAFIYRPITIQKVIQLLITKEQQKISTYLTELETEKERTNITHIPVNNIQQQNMEERQLQNSSSPTGRQPKLSSTLLRICYGDKCRLFKAKGIIRRPMYCMEKRNICSGCHNETLRHRKTEQMEQSILNDFTDNRHLIYLTKFIKAPISLQNFRRLFQYLSSFATTTRNDHIYGASRYFANTLGFIISDEGDLNRIDPSVTETEKKQLWRMATFRCRCTNRCESDTESFGIRKFCKKCSFLIFQENNTHITFCPGCNQNESWETIGKPCISCTLAAIVYKNPFSKRFQQQLTDWLDEISSESSESETHVIRRSNMQNSQSPRNISKTQIAQQRRANIERSFQEIKANAPASQTRDIFRHLAVLQNSIQTEPASQKGSNIINPPNNRLCHTLDNIEKRTPLNVRNAGAQNINRTNDIWDDGTGLAYGNTNKENEYDTTWSSSPIQNSWTTMDSQLDGKPKARQYPNVARPPLTQIETNIRTHNNRLISPENRTISEHRKNEKRPRVNESYNNTSKAAQERTRRAKEKKRKRKSEKEELKP